MALISRSVFSAKLAQLYILLCFYAFLCLYYSSLLCLLIKFFNVEKKQKDELMQRV